MQRLRKALRLWLVGAWLPSAVSCVPAEQAESARKDGGKPSSLDAAITGQDAGDEHAAEPTGTFGHCCLEEKLFSCFCPTGGLCHFGAVCDGGGCVEGDGSACGGYDASSE